LSSDACFKASIKSKAICNSAIELVVACSESSSSSEVLILSSSSSPVPEERSSMQPGSSISDAAGDVRPLESSYSKDMPIC
jgi:hypothetical protein